MIGRPLNDEECLLKLCGVAQAGVIRDEVRELAERFGTTAQLRAWIRSLPQRDDDGNLAEGPRVACDVPQRMRLAADDPNCVERSVLYLAVAEVIDPTPVRQLATIDTPNGRHTFPVEDGEVVKLDPIVPRNALRAGVWALRDGGQETWTDFEPALAMNWLLDIAEDVAARHHGDEGAERVDRARDAFRRLHAGVRLSTQARDHLLYALRAAAHEIEWFGELGRRTYRAARKTLARLFARASARNARLVIKPPIKVDPERAIYWTGKAVATSQGLGGLYDVMYADMVRRPGGGPRSPPAPRARPVIGARVRIRRERVEGTPAPAERDEDGEDES